MVEILSEQTISQLFETVLQHTKCIEIRLDYARALSSQKQKYVLTQALNKARAAIDNICSLLPDSDSILKVKKKLDESDMVYVMILTEQLMKIRPSDMEEVIDLIDNFLINKYGQSEQVQCHGEVQVS